MASEAKPGVPDNGIAKTAMRTLKSCLCGYGGTPVTMGNLVRPETAKYFAAETAESDSTTNISREVHEMRSIFRFTVLAAAFASGAQAYGQAQPAAGEPSATDLAKTTQNPVGDIVSVPFQFNFNSGGAYQDQTFFNLNFQPVIPIHLNKKITLISRTIVPIDSIPTGNGTSSSGVGDINQQTYFTPAKTYKIIAGVGPSFSFPTATASPAKTGTWAGGVSGVLLAQPGPFVVGSLLQQLWPMSDSGGAPKTNLFLWQYFINYNFGQGWALTTAPNMTANWDAEEGQRWTIPVGGGISRTLIFNRQPMTLGFQYYYNAMRPDNANATTVRFVFALIYPQRH